MRVSCLCPQGVNTDMLRGGDGARRRRRGRARRPASCSSPRQVADIVADAIAEERFLILPHPEVHDFMQRKADDPDRWLAGMRKLQARVLGVT